MGNEQGSEAATPSSGVILVIDPSEFPESSLAPLFSQAGFAVEVVPDTALAFAVLERIRPVIIITELYLPGTDGLDFLRQLRNNTATRDTPRIVLTARRGTTLADECARAGADEFMQKPADHELLLLKIRRLLQKVTGAAGQANAATEGVTGKLRDMSFPELIQILCASAKSDEVVVRQNGRHVHIFIQRGEIIHAVAGDVTGEPALYEAMKWADGEFQVKSCETFPERTIHASTMSLLMEGARLRDEAGIA